MTREGASPKTDGDIRWRDVWIAYGVSLVLTIVLGGVLFTFVEQNVWWIALAGVAGLLIGGGFLAAAHRRSDALGGTLVAVVYFATVLVVVVGGTLLELLPDPLPGLPIGDSTFFFVWPLTQLAAAVLGATLGHRRPAPLRR